MWYLSDLARLQRERDAVARIDDASAWLDGVHWHLDGSQLCLDVDVVLDDGARTPLRVRFPQHYPNVPPAVRPRTSVRLSAHQYGPDGDLCLELGPDNWHPEGHTAADMLESAHRLLSLELQHGEDAAEVIPSRHAVTSGQALRATWSRLVLTDSAGLALESIGDQQVRQCSLVVVFHNRCVVAHVARIAGEDGEDWINPDVPEAALKRLGSTVHGVALGGTQGALGNAAYQEPSQWGGLLASQSITPLAEPVDGSVDVVLLKSSPTGDWRALWRWSDPPSITSFDGHRIAGAAPGSRLGDDNGSLAEGCVAVVGLGSAGSKMAASLARSGVGHFVLLDDDLLEPGNLVRHDGDWFDVGQHKVDAVAERIERINPLAKTVCRRHRLRGQESTSAAASALSALSSADLIIDASANPAVFTLCAHVARTARKPLVWLEVYAGGIGGVIARTRPDRDVEPFTLRAAIHALGNKLAAEKEVEPPEGAPDYAARVGEGGVLIADDADVSAIAALATQMATDVLLNEEPSRFPYPAYLVGLQRGWIFDEPLQSYPVETDAAIDWSSVVPADDETCAAGVAFIVELIEAQSTNVDADSSD